jgi:hypothetical protein
LRGGPTPVPRHREKVSSSWAFAQTAKNVKNVFQDTIATSFGNDLGGFFARTATSIDF